MNEGLIFGKGLSFPPRIDSDGRFAWSSGSQNVRECIRVTLMTQFNERIMLPDYGCGLQAQLFEPNTVTTRRLIEESVQQALGRWEPRARVEAVTVEEDPQNSDAALITIEYQLVANQSRERLNLTVTFNQ